MPIGAVAVCALETRGAHVKLAYKVVDHGSSTDMAYQVISGRRMLRLNEPGGALWCRASEPA
jgi:hypothetical protein